MNLYYTYAYLREDRTPYYIGKGKGNRAFRKRNKGVRPPSEDRILLLKQNLTEEEAFKHEVYMISLFGRKDQGTGVLLNRTNGGDGISGHKQSQAEKLKHSLATKKARGRPEIIEKYNKTLQSFEYREKKRKLQLEVMSRPGVREKLQQEYYSNSEWLEKCSQRNQGNKNPCHGKKWWVNPDNHTKYQSQSPGENWQNGRKYKPLANPLGQAVFEDS